MDEPLIILLQFQDGKYPGIKQEAYKSNDKEILEIVNFFNNVICRANVFKEENNHYPEDIEDLKGWEDIRY